MEHQQSSHEGHEHQYLLLDWQQNGQVISIPSPAPTPPPNNKHHGLPLSHQTRRQPKPTSSANIFQSSTTSLHSKSNPHPPEPPPLSNLTTDAEASETLVTFYDLRAIHNEQYDPFSEVELHLKSSREKNGKNPEELPEVWKAPPAPITTVSPLSGEGGGEGDDDVEMVSRAPDYSDDDTPPGCRSIQGKYGERSSKNPGVILRYQYELIQDLDGLENSYSSNNFEVDGTEYLVENVMPALEQGVGDVLVRELFEECGGGNGKLRRRERRMWRGLREEGRRLSSTVVGLDGEPVDFPVGQGECISTYTPVNPLQSYQCHIMEGAVTVYFPPNYSYPTVLTAATLQILRAIKTGMESGKLQQSNDNILSLLFLDKSYNLKPVYPGEEVSSLYSNDKSLSQAQEASTSKNNAGLIVGMLFLIIIILGLAAGLFYYKKTRDEEFAQQEARRRELEELNAKMRNSSHSNNSGRAHAVFEDNNDDGTTTSDDGTTTSDEGTTTDGDGTTTSDDGDGTTTSDDDGEGTTTSDDEDSTTSGSKETTTSSDSEDEFDTDDLGPYGNLYQKRKQAREKRKKVKSNIVYTGGDEASVMTGATGATGLHSVSSVRTAKVRNVVPVVGVNINMR
ncbi:hypothetical protein ACHAXN_010920 [Cyclotella atomus]